MPKGKSSKFVEHEKNIAAAIQAVEDHPESKLSYIAHAHNIYWGTLHNRLHKRTRDRRHAHAGQQLLAPEEEKKEVVSDILEWGENGAQVARCDITEQGLPEDIWNHEETGWAIGAGSHHRELLVKSSLRKSAHTAQAGRGQWVTLLECVPTTGSRLPGLYIYLGSAHYFGWYDDTVGDHIGYAYSGNGWADDEIGLRLLKDHFNKHARPSAPGRKRPLYCDNHGSHETYEFMDFCMQNDILLFYASTYHGVPATSGCQPL